MNIKLKESTINAITFAIMVLLTIYALYQNNVDNRHSTNEEQGLLYQEIIETIPSLPFLDLSGEGVVVEIG